MSKEPVDINVQDYPAFNHILRSVERAHAELSSVPLASLAYPQSLGYRLLREINDAKLALGSLYSLCVLMEESDKVYDFYDK